MPSDDDPTLKERLITVAKMGQEPQDRMWAAIYALILIALLVGAIMVFYSENTRKYLEDSRELGFERGAVECLQVVIDNDRTFELPGYCGRYEVEVYYPPEVCEEFFDDVAACGSKWTAS